MVEVVSKYCYSLNGKKYYTNILEGFISRKEKALPDTKLKAFLPIKLKPGCDNLDETTGSWKTSFDKHVCVPHTHLVNF